MKKGTNEIKTIDLSDMKPVGVVRALDGLGRLSVSAEARKCMGISANDLVEQVLYRDENGEFVLVLRKYNEG